MTIPVVMIRFRGEPDAITDVQGFLGRHLLRVFAGDLGERARIAAYELVENAGRYSTAGSDIDLEVLDTGNGFSVKVSNDAVGARVAMLRRQIETAAQLETTEQYARALRRHIETKADNMMRIGFGLLRARHDAIVELSLAVDDRRVVVLAKGAHVATAVRRPPSTSRLRRPNDF